MEFRLTYEGPLYAFNVRLDDQVRPSRAQHVHDIRKKFHRQLKSLWQRNPVLSQYAHHGFDAGFMRPSDGYKWCALATESGGLSCKLDILMLRDGPPGRVLADIDNRLKTLFDALRKAQSDLELGGCVPDADETPFFVLLEDDRLITNISVSTDNMLEPVPNETPENSVRLVISVLLRPYNVTIDNLDFS